MDNRITWVDIFKGLAILLVVVGHTSSPVNGFIYQFHVPSFFFVSGFTTTINSISLKRFFFKKSKTLLIPFYSINLLFIVFVVILTRTNFHNYISNSIRIDQLIKTIFHLILYGVGTDFGGATWFLIVLFEASVLVKIANDLIVLSIQKKILNEGCWVYLIISFSFSLYFIAYVLYSKKYYLPYLSDLSFNAQLYFLVGLLCRKYSILQKIPKSIFILITLGILYYFVKIHWAPMNWPTRSFSHNPFENTVSSLSGIYLLYIVSIFFDKIKILKNIFIYIGQRTMAILAFHFLGMKFSYVILYFLDFLSKQDVKQFVPPHGNNYWMLLMLSTTFFCVFVDFFISRSNFLSFAFLGRKNTG